jgi:hypothetical protein
MNEVIWETDLENNYHVQVIKTESSMILNVKRISDNQILLNEPTNLMVPGSVSTMDIVNWINLAKIAIENNQ